MDYIPVTPEEQKEMLATLGFSEIGELFQDLPKNVPFPAIDFPEGKTELELTPKLRELAAQNIDHDQVLSFLGAGAYHHFIPSVVPVLTGRSEFATAYTPYQPEASQGTLQAIFEFQSFIAALTELPIANASLYDGATALAEAVLMARRVTGRSTVLIAGNMHPHYLEVVQTYIQDLPIQLERVPFNQEGRLDSSALEQKLSDHIACVAISQPNFFGCLEEVPEIAKRVHACGGLLIANAFPVSLGLLRGPGGLGADIVTMEGQSLGNELSYGGPYVGCFACREEYARHIPGRLVGETVDQSGRRGYVLTLQTREQHIRRERATSNICTNQGLAALNVVVYLSVVGRDGLKKRAELCVQKANYLKEAIARLPRFSFPFSSPIFSEFVVQSEIPFVEIQTSLRAERVFPGVDLAPYFPSLQNSFLVSVTELHRKKDLDCLVSLLQKL